MARYLRHCSLERTTHLVVFQGHAVFPTSRMVGNVCGGHMVPLNDTEDELVIFARRVTDEDG